MMIEVKRQITVIQHFTDNESEIVYHALRKLQDEGGHDMDTINHIVAEMDTIGERIRHLVNSEEKELARKRKGG